MGLLIVLLVVGVLFLLAGKKPDPPKLPKEKQERDYRHYLESWRCHICGERRPDAAISVLTRDLSRENGLAAGTIMQNVRYCNDREECISAAPQKRLMPKLSELNSQDRDFLN